MERNARWRARLTASFAVVLLLLPSIALRSVEAGERPEERPSPRTAAHSGSAILISIDSLRADHLPFNGYPRMTAPFMNDLVEKGEVSLFERMTAVSPSCHPSHVAILSGQYPHQVGVPLCGEDLVVKHSDLAFEEDVRSLEEYQADLRQSPAPYRMKKRSAIRNMMQIPPDTPTLATFLHERGYRTGASVAIWTLSGRFGYDRGFDFYADKMTEYYGPRSLAWVLRDFMKTQQRRDGPAALEEALEFIASLESSDRFFLFLHFGDTHVPYEASDGVPFQETPDERAAVEAAWRQRYPESLFEPAMKEMSKSDQHLLDRYDASIRRVDSLIEELFARLEASGRLNDTAVVITSDHGDSFGQHLWLKPRKQNRPFFEHSVYVWEETQGVPLIVYDPSGRLEPRRRSVNASHVDIVPTLLALLGEDADRFAEGGLPGVDLTAAGDGPRTVFFMTFGRGRPGLLRRTEANYPQFLGFRSGDWKFFVDKERLRDASNGRCFLFNLAEDPDEKVNLCGREEHRGKAARFRSTVIDWWNLSTSPRRTESGP